MANLPDDVAIRVEDVRKDFHLPHHNEDSLKSKIITAFEKKDKEVDTQHALRGISFDIKKGEFFGILGRNGSGKSTLLKIISEIYQPTKGKVQRRGTLVAFIELGVGFNPQLTGRENVYLNGALLGFNRKEIDGFYDKVVAFAELENHMEQKLKNYSSGMKVRLAFAVAIQADADILVLDEVLAVGDADFQRKCYDYFKELKDAHKTIVFVSHSMGQVKDYCDRAVLIEDGKITFEGTGEDAANEYLRLFVKSKDGSKQQTSEHWGSGEVQFTSVETVVTGKKVRVKCAIKAVADLKDVIIGLDIYDDRKQVVAGVEDRVQKQHRLEFRAGDTKQLEYTFDNIFGGGDYMVTVSLKSTTGGNIYDFWRYASVFTNVSEADAFFPVVLPVQVAEL